MITLDQIARVKWMSRICELSGTGVMSGNNVSHSERKTKRKFLPNLCRATLLSEVLGASYKFRVTARVLRSVEMRGGLDGYLINADDSVLSKNALYIKKRIKNFSVQSKVTVKL